MSALHSTLQSLAASFAEDVVRVIQGSSLQELLGEVSGGRRGRAPAQPRAAEGAVARAPARTPRVAAAPAKRDRLKRRSADDIVATLNRIVGLLKNQPEGLRAEQIRKELGVEAKELPRPLAEGLAAKTLRKKGQKRATVYFTAAAAGPADAPRTRRKAK